MQVLISYYDILYVSKKTIKGNIITDFLTDWAIEDYNPFDFDSYMKI